MKEIHYFSLQNYFDYTNRYYYYFDGMFKYTDKLKKEVLVDLNIPASTYRLNRIIDNAKNDNHITLLNYFQTHQIDKNYQSKYEKLLSRLYMAIYYKYDSKADYQELESYIEQNNYLKPIFILFRILLKMNQNKLYAEIMEDIREDVSFISHFPKEFFYEELEAIFLMVLLYANQSKEAIGDKTCYSKYPSLLWMYYHVMGSVAYTEEDYSKAILFYEKAEKIYLEDSNIKRYCIAKNNIAAMYNKLHFPQLALEVITPVLNYVLNEETKYSFTKHIIMHYLMALFMLEDYQQIILFNEMYLNDEELKVKVTMLIVLLAYFKMNYKKEEIDYQIIEYSDMANQIYDNLYEKKKFSKEIFQQFCTSDYLKYIAKTMKFIEE